MPSTDSSPKCQRLLYLPYSWSTSSNSCYNRDLTRHRRCQRLKKSCDPPEVVQRRKTETYMTILFSQSADSDEVAASRSLRKGLRASSCFYSTSDKVHEIQLRGSLCQSICVRMEVCGTLLVLLHLDNN